MFTIRLKEITRKYYERRLKKFFDFIEFEHQEKAKNINKLKNERKYQILINCLI